MIKMVTKQNIIHWSLIGMSQRAIALKAKVSRGTVKKVLQEYEMVRQKGDEEAVEDLLTTPPKYDSSHRRAVVLTPEVTVLIHGHMQSNRRKVSMGMRKQRMLKYDIWEDLVKRGYHISYSSVCHYIYKLEHGPAERN